jgi:hypothetical protein
MVRIPVPVAFIPQLIILALMFFVPFAILWYLGEEFGKYDNYPRVFRLLVPTGNKIAIVLCLYVILFLSFPSSFSFITGQPADTARSLSTGPVTMSIGKAGDRIVVVPEGGSWDSVSSVNITLILPSGATSSTQRTRPKTGDAIVLVGTVGAGRDHVICTVTYNAGPKRVVLDMYV